MKCPNCGAENTGAFCAYCGAELPKQPVNIINNYYGTVNNNNGPSPGPAVTNLILTSSKNKIVALIWCILLGYFGAHQFYVGKKGMGWLYVFTVGLFGIGWIVDICLIATGNFKDVYGHPLK